MKPSLKGDALSYMVVDEIYNLLHAANELGRALSVPATQWRPISTAPDATNEPQDDVWVWEPHMKRPAELEGYRQQQTHTHRTPQSIPPAPAMEGTENG